jgi:hypothetical protein
LRVQRSIFLPNSSKTILWANRINLYSLTSSHSLIHCFHLFVCSLILSCWGTLQWRYLGIWMCFVSTSMRITTLVTREWVSHFSSNSQYWIEHTWHTLFSCQRSHLKNISISSHYSHSLYYQSKQNKTKNK